MKHSIPEGNLRMSFFTPEYISLYIKIGLAAIAVLAVILIIVLIRHRYNRDLYVKVERSGRASREIKRVRKLK